MITPKDLHAIVASHGIEYTRRYKQVRGWKYFAAFREGGRMNDKLLEKLQHAVRGQYTVQYCRLPAYLRAVSRATGTVIDENNMSRRSFVFCPIESAVL